jgi:bifunctional non-homologous end joining protein LigD
MTLAEYRRKREFSKTREPEPGKSLPEGQRAIFVVQLHHASRRHYDFRLQVGDTLKSWAVPKGPSYDPDVKRMAVEVEDHPVDYASFEGEIPKGAYGGGHVALFDNGVWATEDDAETQLAKGHLKFELFGKKLKGSWHLVRSGKAARQPQWLLFKAKDQYADSLEADDLLADVTPAPEADLKRAGRGKQNKKKLTTVPTARKSRKDWTARALKLSKAKKARLKNEAFAPQLAKLGTAPPEGEQWIHEFKWDGYRLVTTVVDGKVRIWSRNAIEWTDKVPELRAAVESLGLDSAALDGELIAGQGTQADFNLLQATLSGEQQGVLSYALFDLLHINAVAIDQSPLVERKALLQELLKKPVPHLGFSSHVAGDGDGAYELAVERKFEGIISKRGDRPYHPGRGEDWRKTKALDSDEFAVVGYTPAKGSRTGFGSLLLARPDAEHGWVYVGRVGTGFNNQQLRQLTARIGKAGSAKPSVHIEAKETDLKMAKWFPPRFVIEAFVRGISNQGVLRQPSLKAIRLDKDVADLGDSDRRTGKKMRATKAADKKISAGSIRLTSPDRVVYAESNLTKLDVANYYLAVMEHLLPEIAGRPLSVIRCPDGTGKPCFFQKHHTAGMKIVGSVRLKEESGKMGNYLVVDSAESLMELVQFSALEFHPWGAQADTPDKADRIVFDLDPGPEVPFAEVKRAARQLRDMLAQVKLVSFLRTSGGKGLHVVVPLNPANDWTLVKRFAHGVADTLAKSQPKRFVAVSTLKLRPGKIFVDYLRNDRGATSVASYSLRARPGAPVAMPLAWSDLSRLSQPDAFNLANVPAKLKRRKQDPWEGIERIKQNLARWKE